MISRCCILEISCFLLLTILAFLPQGLTLAAEKTAEKRLSPGDVNSIINELVLYEDLDSLILIANNSYGLKKRKAIEGIGKLGISSAFKYVAPFLTDSDIGIRKVSTEAVGQLGDRRAIPLLFLRLCDSVHLVRIKIIYSLEKLGRESAERAIIFSLHDKNRTVRCAAIRALGRLKSRIAIKPLIRCLDSNQSFIQQTTLQSLAKITGLNYQTKHQWIEWYNRYRNK